MSPILILYGTVDGQTKKIASALAETLRHEGADVDVRNAAADVAFLRPEVYAGILVAAPVHLGRYPRPVERWLRTHAEALRRRPSAFVSVCLGILDPRPETQREVTAIVERCFQRTGWRPELVKAVAGALLYSRYGWLKRRILRRIARQSGGDTDWTRDYEYTDWDDLRAFAHSFLELVYGRSVRAAAG